MEEVYVHLGKYNDNDCHIIIRGTLDDKFLEELQDLLSLHEYTESL